MAMAYVVFAIIGGGGRGLRNGLDPVCPELLLGRLRCRLGLEQLIAVLVVLGRRSVHRRCSEPRQFTVKVKPTHRDPR